MTQQDPPIALITGAAGDGIGRSTAFRLAADGYRVIVTDVHAARIEATVSAIADTGGLADGFELDVGADDAATRIREIAKAVGPIEVLINNAGLNQPAPATEITSEQWDPVMTANVRGPALLTAAVLPSMIERGRGNIVMISSVAAWTTSGYGGAYAPSKAALHSYMKNVAAEAGPSGVRCNGVAPGIIRSKWVDAHPERYADEAAKTPLRRLGEPAEVADVVAFLVSDQARFITGEVINVSGGWYMRA
ncbi:MAG: SDR family oxidoreductase [Ilumatobacteraceae bacterium]|nr:SDR family oxidoreductase [Ilumatobacteraceae bacterium]